MAGKNLQNKMICSDVEMKQRENVEHNVHGMIDEMGIKWTHLCGRPDERMSELFAIFEYAKNLPKQTYFARYWGITNSKHQLIDSVNQRFVDFINATFEEPSNITVEDFLNRKLTFKLPEQLKDKVAIFYNRAQASNNLYHSRFLRRYTLLYYSAGTPTVGYLKIKSAGTRHFCAMVTGFTSILDGHTTKQIDKWIDTVLTQGDGAIKDNSAVQQWIRNENASFYYGPVEIYPEVLVIYGSEIAKPHEKIYISFDTSVFAQQKLSEKQPWLGGVGMVIRNYSNRSKAFPLALACRDAVEIGSLSSDTSSTSYDDNLFAKEWLGGWRSNISKIHLYSDIWETKRLTTPREILEAGDLYRENGLGYTLTVTDRAELSYLMLKEYLKECNGRVISETEAADKCLFLYVNSKLTVSQRSQQ